MEISYKSLKCYSYTLLNLYHKNYDLLIVSFLLKLHIEIQVIHIFVTIHLWLNKIHDLKLYIINYIKVCYIFIKS